MSNAIKLFHALILMTSLVEIHSAEAQVTYSIGGNLSGLNAGNFVTLLNNGVNALTIGGNGSFTFTSTLASGPYAVTVAIQPAGQTCSVSNGSGTVSGANVTNISVNCVSTYTVSGSIAGLTGTRLVIRMNSTSLIIAKGSTTFNFSTALTNGASYTVSVGIQPAGLICLVNNGSGVINAANINNVSVTCEPTYSVSGSISGLTASGLVLRLNDAINKIIPNSATSYTFTTSLTAGTPYSVAILTQPIGYTCTLSNSSGTIISSNVTNINIICKPIPTFPVVVSSNHRYLQDQKGVPFPILGRASWYVLSRNIVEYQSYLSDTISKGFNSIELKFITHDPIAHNAPYAGNGTLPFLKTIAGANWSGSLNYSNIENDAPDFTTPNEEYWSFVDSFLDYCSINGILVFGFPAYVGYMDQSGQGWLNEMAANGHDRMQIFGAWLAQRWSNRKNIVWMLGGDAGTGNNVFSSDQIDAEQGLISGLKSIAGQSTHYAAEWNTFSTGADESTFWPNLTLNGAYDNTGPTYTIGRQAYTDAPTKPAFNLEQAYDETASDGTGENLSATQPVRRFIWWGTLSTIGGYITGNGYVWRFNTGVYNNHLNTPGARDLAVLNGFYQSLAWHRLVPDGLDNIGTLITNGAGLLGEQNHITAAATHEGDLLVAYIPPDHSGSFFVDMNKLRNTVSGRWFDPTSGSYSDTFFLSNVGTHEFITPGQNAAGSTDWVLVLKSP